MAVTNAKQSLEAKVAIVRSDRLFVSEPDPRMFGNPRNPQGTSATNWTNPNWLKSRFHFSFAEYSNGPSNFGVLRVMNDDLVQPDRGFGAHPHRDMEIITFVVDGELTHQDSMGTKETLGRGSVQFMTAGTGVNHSEHNLDKHNHLRFIQSWIVPRRRGLTPNYGSMAGDEVQMQARKDKWAHIVSDVASSLQTPVRINQDCNVFLTELGPNVASPSLTIGSSRQAYLLCVEGAAKTNGEQLLQHHDAAELQGPMSLELNAGGNGAMVLVFEMASTGDTRRNL